MDPRVGLDECGKSHPTGVIVDYLPYYTAEHKNYLKFDV
jgi:hypothetical protein